MLQIVIGTVILFFIIFIAKYGFKKGTTIATHCSMYVVSVYLFYHSLKYLFDAMGIQF
ncbi:hypothetical protein [Priestia endophytica]|uniref:Uncharacterized protein n=1 Tax=Priestia endophytica DSM 13796 TaxID=1121089 RepID=A0A1I6C060_9BACI|nr:hypothetical protein [Priestia endophytica]SFQ86561.1 hypothetical protein SAMN02745910_04668 [Priestia endophytica DSM 13796]